MYKTLTLIVLVFGCAKKKPEDRLPLQLIDYSDLVAKYKKHSDLVKMGGDYDMLNILLLDSTNADLFFKIAPRLRNDYISVSKIISSREFAVGFVTEAQTLRELLVSEVFTDRMFNCINPIYPVLEDDLKIFDPVYIKDNRAIITISNKGESIFDVYYITLDDRIVHMTLISTVIED